MVLTGDTIRYITPDDIQCTIGRYVSPSRQNSNQKTDDYNHNEIYRTKEEQKVRNHVINRYNIKLVGQSNININVYTFYLFSEHF